MANLGAAHRGDHDELLCRIRRGKHSLGSGCDPKQMAEPSIRWAWHALRLKGPESHSAHRLHQQRPASDEGFGQ